MQIFFFKLFSTVNWEPSWLESTVSGSNNDSFSVMLLFGCCQQKRPIRHFFHHVNLFRKTNGLFKVSDLTFQLLNKLFSRYARKSSDIVNMFVGIKKRDLPPQDRESFNNFHFCVSHTGIEGCKQTSWASANNCNVIQFIWGQ